MSFVRSNFKIFNLARLRCFQNISHNYHTYLHLICPRTGITYMRFASTAHNLKPISEAVNGKDFFKVSNYSQFERGSETRSEIDEALLHIDFAVKRTGRTVLETVKQIFEMIEITGTANEKQSLYLLRCCGLLHLELPSTRIQLVHNIWNKLESLGVQYGVKHYNALLKVYLDSNHNFKPSDILVLMEKNNVEPNQTTYLHMIEKCCRDGDLNSANEILECIKEKGITVNEAVFNSLIKGHMKINDESGAKQIIDIMRSSNISPSASTYTIMACGFVEKGDIKNMEQILLEAQNNEVVLQNNDYLKIISSLVSNDKEECAEKILMKMEENQKWRQDFVNTAAELVNNNKDDFAFKMLKYVSKDEKNNVMNIFIKQQIKLGKPIEKIIEYSCQIYDEGLNSYIFINAAKASLDYERFDHAMAFFLEMQRRGIPVRNQNFRELFKTKQNLSDVWKYLKCMSELGLHADFYTYVDHIIPALPTEDPEEVLSKIKESGQTVLSAVDPLFEHYCDAGNVKNASYLIEKFPVGVNRQFNLKHFLSLYEKSNQDKNDYFKVLKYILENIGLPHKNNHGLRGEQLALFLLTNPNMFDEFHKFSWGLGCNYHPHSLAVCRAIISEKNPNLLGHLRRFQINSGSDVKPLKDVTLEEEENILKSEKGNNPAKMSQLVGLFTLHLKNKDVERFTRVTAELDKMNFVYTPTMLVQIFSFHCEVNNLDEATEVFTKIKSSHPTFKVDSAKLFDYARLMLKFSKVDEAVAVIKSECKELNIFSGEDILIRSMRRFLNNIVQLGDSELAKTVQDILKNHGNTPVLKEVIFEPLLKINIYKKDLEGCLNEYKNCVRNFRSSPCLNLLLKHFILYENQSLLQELVDLASSCEGNNKVLHKLVVAFIELDQLQQAIKVIKNLDRNIDMMHLAETGMHYYSQNRTIELENLLYVTSGITHDSRKVLYHHLLKLYSKKNDHEKAAHVLDLMIKENIELSNDIKTLVNNLFQMNNKSVPFPENAKFNGHKENINIMLHDDVVKFKTLLNQQKVPEILQQLEVMKKGYVRSLPFEDLANFVDLLIEHNKLNDLSKNVNAMSYIIENSMFILKPLLEKYSTGGNVEALQTMSSVFPDFSLRKLSFNNFAAKAYISSNRHLDLLTELENRCDMKNKLFSISAFEELLKLPEYEERVINLAKKYSESSFIFPISVAWVHYFTSERYEKADALCQNYPVSIDRVDTMILRSIRQTENIPMGYKYIENVNKNDAKSRCKERAYGTLLDLLVLKQMFDDAVNLVVEAKSKNITLERHYSSTLITLKSYLEGKNKHVPFTILSEVNIEEHGE